MGGEPGKRGRTEGTWQGGGRRGQDTGWSAEKGLPGPGPDGFLSSLSQSLNTVGKTLCTIRGCPSSLGRNCVKIISSWRQSFRKFSGEGFLSLPPPTSSLSPSTFHLPSQPPLLPGPRGPLPLGCPCPPSAPLSFLPPASPPPPCKISLSPSKAAPPPPISHIGQTLLLN